MKEIRKPAVKINQGKHALFLTSFTIGDFLAENFYRIDKLDVKREEGMQRLLNAARSKSFGRDIIQASEENEAFLPTSVFLATEGAIDYDDDKRELYFTPGSDVLPFDVVDGQHRIEGLKFAVEKDEALLRFPISVVIAHKMSEAEKMLQFLIVNTKQQPVDAGVTQFITARVTKMLEVRDLPYIPSWLKKTAEQGGDQEALALAKELNGRARSPWNGKIQFADETKQRQHTVNQATVVKSIKRILLTQSHPLMLFNEGKRLEILLNFWSAVQEICVVDPLVNTVVFKNTGIEFFHSILRAVLTHLANDRDYTKENMKKYLLSAQEYLPQSAAGVLSPDFWKSGGPSSGLNRGGIGRLVKDFGDALGEASNADKGEIRT